MALTWIKTRTVDVNEEQVQILPETGSNSKEGLIHTPHYRIKFNDILHFRDKWGFFH